MFIERRSLHKEGGTSFSRDGVFLIEIRNKVIELFKQWMCIYGTCV